MLPNKTIPIAVLLVATALSGCFGGGGGDNGDDTTDPGNIDPNALFDHANADSGFRFQGGLTGDPVALTTTPAGGDSAADLKVVDVDTSDSTTADGTQDKATFIMDAQVDGGSRYQLELTSLLAASDLGQASLGIASDFMGGVAQNLQVFGTTGVGAASFPETKAFMLTIGQVRLALDGESIEGRHPVVILVTNATHDESGVLMSAPAEDRLEMHVYLPGGALGPDWLIPGIGEESLYFVFTDVRLRELDDAAKADVGSGLVPPQIPNEDPLAQMAVLINGMGNHTDNGTIDLDVNEGNLTVVLDGKNSTDIDGVIDVYAWDVREYRNNTSIEKYFSGVGEQVTLNFTTPGVKVITLRVIDDDFGQAEQSIVYNVHYKKLFTYKFGSGESQDAVGGGQDCVPASNCKTHSFTVQWGALGGTFDYTNQISGTCNSATLDVTAPGGGSVNSASGDFTLAADQLSTLGQYSLQVYFQAQAQCEYSVDALVTYGLPPEAGSGDEEAEE